MIDGVFPDVIPLERVMQQVDDAAEALSFEKANIYTKAQIRLGTDRLLKPVLLPYRVAKSSRGYTHYVLVE